MGKKRVATEATRKALLDAFCLIARDKPIEKITILEITKKAGYNRCTFYQYFKDVYDLLDYIENIVLSQIKENFEKNISRDDFIRTFFNAFTRIQQERGEYFNLLLSPANHSHFTEKLMTNVMPIFMEQFRLSEKNPKAEYLASIYFATVVTAISRWIYNDRNLPLKEFSEMLGNVLSQGVLTEIKFYEK